MTDPNQRAGTAFTPADDRDCEHPAIPAGDATADSSQQSDTVSDANATLAAPTAVPPVAEGLARLFHETYERLAPSYGYQTREASAKPWSDVPEPNRSLMIAVAGEVAANWPSAALDGQEVERLRAEAIRHGERATEEFGRAEELMAEVGRLTGEVAERTRERDDALRRHHNLAYLTAPDVFAAAQADTCDCAGEQCAGPRETCAAFPTEPESLKAQYSVRSLDYIRELYRVPAEVNGRVIFDGDPGKITGALGPYLLVLLDGDDEPVPVHPTWHMSYVTTEVTDEASPSGEGTAK